jgi:protease-4
MKGSGVWIGLLVVAASGCRGPVRAITQNRVVLHSSVEEDRGPLAEMPVFRHPGGASEGEIALVDVDGLLLNMDMTGLGSLGENPVALFREKLDRVAADPCYRAVVLRINSPGGSVTATDVMWHDLRAFQAQTRLPVVACLMDLGTGGAYYLATAADHIVAHPTTVTGGMGVILNLYNLQEAMLYFQVYAAPIKAGRHTDLGTPVEPLDDESRAILQEVVESFHARFREVVAQGRPQHDPAQMDDFDGRIFTARQALQRRLIDSIGYLDDAVAVARQLGKCPTARVVMLHRSNDPARSPYAVSPNSPIHGALMPISVPGLDRSQMPTFLYLWQPEPTLERRVGR